ncbi:MAG TPA: TetR/AcrR family transcriptional regulator [Solirubrobacterales bacterium]|nr:TetR/AcrR family transcriptional regulator [Solirubrobacterales bacterium]
MPRRAKIRPDEPGRERILDAARAQFGERGYDATSIAEIGAGAGISKSVLYHYFGSKAGLYRALLEHDSQELIEAVAAVVPPPDADAPRLRPGVDAFLKFLSEHPGTWKLMTRDPPADPALRDLHRKIDRSVASTLRHLLADPGKRESRPELVDLIAMAVRTYASWWQLHREVPREQVVAAIGDLAAAAGRRIRSGRAVRSGQVVKAVNR